MLTAHTLPSVRSSHSPGARNGPSREGAPCRVGTGSQVRNIVAHTARASAYSAARAPPPPPPRAGRARQAAPLPARFHWELIACGAGGHQLLGTDAREIRPDDAAVVRESDGIRWHRCVRCDAWIHCDPGGTDARPSASARGGEAAAAGSPAARQDRPAAHRRQPGAPHDRLRRDRCGHLFFSANRQQLHDKVLKVVTDITGSTGGETATHGSSTMSTGSSTSAPVS